MHSLSVIIIIIMNTAYVSISLLGDYPAEILCQCPSSYDVFVDIQMANFDEVSKWLQVGQMNWKDSALIHYINRGFMDPLLSPGELLRMDTPFTDMVAYILGNLTADFLNH